MNTPAERYGAEGDPSNEPLEHGAKRDRTAMVMMVEQPDMRNTDVTRRHHSPLVVRVPGWRPIRACWDRRWHSPTSIAPKTAALIITARASRLVPAARAHRFLERLVRGRGCAIVAFTCRVKSRPSRGGAPGRRSTIVRTTPEDDEQEYKFTSGALRGVPGDHASPPVTFWQCAASPGIG